MMVNLVGASGAVECCEETVCDDEAGSSSTASY